MSKNSDVIIALLEKRFDIAFAAPDGIKKLRELILSLAMQGKLVPQDPSDQPVSELLKEIEAEKNRLVKEGKIKKSKPSLEIKPDEIPYELPNGWEWVYLGKLTTFTYGKTPESKNPIYWSQTDGENWAAISDLPLRGYLYSTNKKITQQAVDDVFKSEPLPVGTLLMSFKLSIGKTAISKIPVYHNEAIISFRELLPELKMYLFWILSSISNSGDHKNAIKGNTLNSTSLNNLRIPLPPLAEQRRIVAKIDELMARCDELEKRRGDRDHKQIVVHTAALNRLLIAKEQSEFNTAWQFITQHFSELYSVKENLTELRKAILQLAVMGKLVPQDPNEQPASELLKAIAVEKQRLVKEGKIKQSKPLPQINLEEVPYKLPKGWIWVKIDAIVRSFRNDIRTGPFGSSLHKTDHRTKGVPVWGIESINKNGSFNGKNKIYVDVEKAHELSSFGVQGGDIIVSRSGTIGELCRLPNNVPYGLLSTNLMKISLDKQIILSDYFCLLFKGSHSINAQLTELCCGSTRLFLTQSILAKLLFPLPPLAEQHRIVTKIDQLMALCDNLEKQIDKANSKQAAILNAVMTNIGS